MLLRVKYRKKKVVLCRYEARGRVRGKTLLLSKVRGKVRGKTLLIVR